MKLSKKEIIAIVEESTPYLKKLSFERETESPDTDVAALLLLFCETTLELYADLEKAQLNEAYAIHDRLCAQAELADIHNSHKFIMDEKCSSQEKHCGCVPLLRAELTALKAANEPQLQAMIENQNKFLLDKLRDLQRRFNELKTELTDKEVS